MAFDIEVIDKKIDRAVTAAIPLSETMGGIPVRSYLDMMELAKSIATGTISIRKHLRNSPGDILVLMMQARAMNLEPIGVMNKSYSVNDQLCFESQLIHAAVQKMAPLERRLDADFIGEGPARQCIVTGHLKGEPKPKVYTSPKIVDIKPQNSPLWKTDPDQQLFYYSVRAWSRRWVPDILLGVYSKDEIEDSPEAMQNITPATPTVGDRLRERKDKKASGEGFNTPKITQQMNEVVPDKIIERETVRTENRAAKGEASSGDEAPRETAIERDTPERPGTAREAPSDHQGAQPGARFSSDDPSIAVMQEAQSGSVAATPAQPDKAAAKPRKRTPVAEAKPVEETPMQRGTRLLPGQMTKGQVEELQESIAQELGSLESEQWIALCEARINELKPR